MTVAHSAARRKGGTQRKNTRLDDVQSKKFIGTTIELKPTPVGCVCSAFAVDITGPSWLSFHPVSYTHLDVYKRQIYHFAVQAEAQQRAVTSARRATELATDRYRSGIVAYIEVVDASRDTLTAERGNAELAGQRLIASVQLIKALGGGWSEQQLMASATPVNSQLSTANQK